MSDDVLGIAIEVTKIGLKVRTGGGTSELAHQFSVLVGRMKRIFPSIQSSDVPRLSSVIVNVSSAAFRRACGLVLVQPDGSTMPGMIEKQRDSDGLLQRIVWTDNTRETSILLGEAINRAFPPTGSASPSDISEKFKQWGWILGLEDTEGPRTVSTEVRVFLDRSPRYERLPNSEKGRLYKRKDPIDD